MKRKSHKDTSSGDVFARLDNDLTQEQVTPKKRGRRRHLSLVPVNRPAPMPFPPVDDGSLPDMSGRFVDAKSALAFIQAGNATITLRSRKTLTRFTYKIRASDDRSVFFVGLLTGPDNETQYNYIGRISRGVFWQGRKYPKAGDVSKDAPSIIAFKWSYEQLAKGKLPDALEIWHEGICGRCGRKLTVPESIASGFGPECAGKVGAFS